MKIKLLSFIYLFISFLASISYGIKAGFYAFQEEYEYCKEKLNKCT